ncbi:helix-turn-helix domain-containing protein [Altererythrobacter sp. N1]|nr:helix-turn-helix domain-containing protein [Altererythrobacter sp. N1]
MKPNLAFKLDTHDAQSRAVALPSPSADIAEQPAMSARDAVRPAILRQRFKLGPLDFDYRTFPRQRAVSLSASETTVHIVLPITGTVVAVSKADTLGFGAGSALLLAASNRNTVVCAAGSSALFLHIPRAAIQAQASRASGKPRRLAAIDHMFGWSIEHLGVMLSRATAPGETGHPSQDDVDLERSMLEGLAAVLWSDPAAETLFPIARSVERAVEQIRANPRHNWAIHELAQAAGVTAGTLRRNFRTCLGVTATQLIQQIRLEWVRSSLGSMTESRSVQQLALAAGFGASGMMSKAYRRRFGETPTQTRARAFSTVRE